MKVKAEFYNVMFMVVDYTYYFCGDEGDPTIFGATKYKM
jgi:hypothetical protein